MKVPTSPIPVAPPVTGPAPSTADGDPAAAAIFSALVAAVLGGAGCAGEPPAVAVADDLTASDESGVPAGAPAGIQDEAETLTAPLLAMSLAAAAAPIPPTTPVPGGTGEQLVAGAALPALPAEATTAPTGGATVQSDQAAGSESGSPATAGHPVTPVPSAAPLAQGRPATPGNPQLPAALTPAPTAAGNPATPVDGSAPYPATPARSDTPVVAGTEPTTPAPAVGQSVAMTSTLAVAPATAAAEVPGSGPASGSAVVRQVVPEVTRLFSNGAGIHRVTLQLNPEALGEVRVVLTVRDGSVHVRLAAGNAAQQAILEGTPELRRLLELAGAGETRIVVRDLPSGSASGTTVASASTGPGGDGSSRHESGQAGTAGQGSPDRHAGTRGGGPARDGTDDGAIPPRLVDQVAHTRSAGVDVTV